LSISSSRQINLYADGEFDILFLPKEYLGPLSIGGEKAGIEVVREQLPFLV